MLGRLSPVNQISAPRVLAIVLNWRQPRMTLQCVRALLDMERADGLDVLVVDNGSGDDSPAVLAAEQDDFELLLLPQNIGFGAANNIGLRLAGEREYDYALLVNNDAFAGRHMLGELLAASRPDIGLCSPKITYESDPARVWFAGGRQGILTLDLQGTGKDQPDGNAWAVSRDVDYLLGTCLLVNLAAAAAVGLFDEQFFFYFEDLDWSIRMRQGGYRLRLVTTARLRHRVAASTGSEEDSPLRRYHLARSSILFWRKHARLGSRSVIFMFRLASAIKMIARLSLRGRWATVRSYLAGLVDGLRASAR